MVRCDCVVFLHSVPKRFTYADWIKHYRTSIAALMRCMALRRRSLAEVDPSVVVLTPYGGVRAGVPSGRSRFRLAWIDLPLPLLFIRTLPPPYQHAEDPDH